MLRIIIDAIPHVIAAGIIITLAYYLGKFASQLITSFLGSTGVDKAINSLGLFPRSDASVDGVTGAEQVS
ncbi:hypothetical protein ACC811_37355, partial [Rhizobium ruizarguesonis]